MTAQPSQTSFAKDQLKAIVERIERMEEEKAATVSDIRDIYAEAKGQGFDVHALRTIVKMRKMDTDARREQEQVLETYMHALGMLVGTPLGDSALDRAAKQGTTARMAQTSNLAQDMAAAGMISQEAADETSRLASAVSDKFGAPSAIVEQLARNPKIQRVIKKLGTPVELTDEEKAKGYSASLLLKDGTRMSIGAVTRTESLVNPKHLPSNAAVKAIADRAESKVN